MREIGKKFWLEDIFQLPDDLHCLIALKQMQLLKKNFAMVYSHSKVNKSGGKVYLGILDYTRILKALVAVMPQIDCNFQTSGKCVVNEGVNIIDGGYKYEAQVTDAGRKFAALPLREVLQLSESPDEMGFTPTPSIKPIYGDDFLFNVIYRFSTCKHIYIKFTLLCIIKVT